MKQRNIVMINDDYSDWKIKGLLAEVVGYDRDKRYLVKLLEKSQTEYLNIGDAIWLKPHWLDGIENICNCFTAIHKFPYDLKSVDGKRERWKEYKERSRRDKVEFWISYGDTNLQGLTRKQVISKVRYALQNKLDFDVSVMQITKWGSASGRVIESSFKENSYHVYERNFTEISKLIRGFQRQLVKVVESY